jgi:hypothetical protein
MSKAGNMQVSCERWTFPIKQRGCLKSRQPLFFIFSYCGGFMHKSVWVKKGGVASS